MERGAAWSTSKGCLCRWGEGLTCPLPGCDLAFRTAVCSEDGAVFTLKPLSEQGEDLPARTDLVLSPETLMLCLQYENCFKKDVL